MAEVGISRKPMKRRRRMSVVRRRRWRWKLCGAAAPAGGGRRGGTSYAATIAAAAGYRFGCRPPVSRLPALLTGDALLQVISGWLLLPLFFTPGSPLLLDRETGRWRKRIQPAMKRLVLLLLLRRRRRRRKRMLRRRLEKGR
jgi:hypothetical protein